MLSLPPSLPPLTDGAPILGIASDIVITISPSDDAYGVFSFSDDSLSQVVSEDQSGSRLVSYVVERGNKGRLGTVTVYWEVVNGGNDVSQSSGSIVFGPGVPTSVFFFTINNDIVSERMRRKGERGRGRRKGERRKGERILMYTYVEELLYFLSLLYRIQNCMRTLLLDLSMSVMVV